MKPIFNFIRIGYGLPGETSWEKEKNVSFNRFHIPLSGKALVRLEGTNERILQPGNAYLLPANVNMFLGKVGSESFKHLYVDFYIFPGIVNKDVVAVDLEKDSVLNHFKDIFQSFVDDWNGEYVSFAPMDVKGYFICFMEAMLTYILDTYGVKYVENEKIAKAMTYISEHYAEDISNDDIAESIHVHPRHLTRLFKEEFNKTPHQCLVEYRINMAINMLREGQQINEVCYKCGFKDVVTFRLAFKRMNYLLPSKYKPIQEKTKRSDNK